MDKEAKGRICNACNEFKSPEELYINGNSGYHSICRQCQKEGKKSSRKKYLITEEGRECTFCNEFKLYSEYHKDKKVGYKSKCKQCTRIYDNNLRYSKGRKPRKEYVVTEEGRECTQCLTFKQYSEFNKATKGRNGYTARCRECDNKYYLENAKHIKTRVNEYRLENQEEIKERKKQDYIRNGDYIRARVKRYQEENEDLLRERKRIYAQSENGRRAIRNSNAKRKKRSKHLGGEFTHEQRQYILERDDWRCQSCGTKVHDTYKRLEKMTPKQRKTKATIDHIIPVAKGGTSVNENGQVLCYSCNASKRDRIENVELQLSLF